MPQAVFWWLIGAGGTGALLLGALSIYISRKEIAGPIAGMTQAMEKLASMSSASRSAWPRTSAVKPSDFLPTRC